MIAQVLSLNADQRNLFEAQAGLLTAIATKKFQYWKDLLWLVLRSCMLLNKIPRNFILFVFLILAPTAAAAQAYQVVEVSPPNPGESSVATAINNQGEIIGIAKDKKGRSVAFYWRDGKSRKIGNFDEQQIFMTGLNDLGQAVGYAVPDRGRPRAFILNLRGGPLIDLPNLDGTVSLAGSINNAGEVVGRFHEAHAQHDHEHGERAFKFKNGQIIDIQETNGLNRLGAARSDGIAINNAGQVVGHIYTSVHIGYSHGFFFQEGQAPIDIGTLGGKATIVTGVNDSGQVVGFSHTTLGQLRAFVWDRTHKFLTLQPFPGGTQSHAYDINNRGEIVGAADSSLNRLRAFLYAGGRMRDLNTLIPKESGWELVTAKAINDKGQIIGEGIYRGERRAFVLTPRN